MKTVWTKGLSEQQKEEIRGAFNGSANLRSRLTAILNEKIESRRKDSIGVDKYNSPGWAYIQADTVGYERALNEVISLILSDAVEKQ
jgi:hypothetical protein